MQGTGPLRPYPSGRALLGCLSLFLVHGSSPESHLRVLLLRIRHFSSVRCAVHPDFKQNPGVVKIFEDRKRGAKRHAEAAAGR